MANRSDRNVALLNADPRTSIPRLALPVMVTMIITSLYNVVDGIWIAGLGESAISGIGLITPLWMVITAVTNGLAHGATSAVSRLGSHDKSLAEKAAEHALVLYLIGALILTVSLLAVLRPYLNYFDVEGPTRQAAIGYAQPLFLGLVGFTMQNGCAGLMRAEGDTRRPMYACSLGLILNGCLDPVFIYTLGMGAAGAAVSTVVTSCLSAAIMLYWMFVKRDTFYRMRLHGILHPEWDKAIARDILSTGIPASLELIMMSIASFMFFSFIRTLGGDYGVSVYSSGYRLYLLNLMPVSALSLASVAIVGTWYGKGDMANLRRTHNYCTLYAVTIGLAITCLVVLFSHQLSQLFALTSDDVALIDGISRYIRITAFCIPFLGLGLPSTFMYLGMGKGTYSLAWTIINEVICAVSATYLLGFVFNLGLVGMWWGFVLGRGFASICNFIFARYTINRLS
ncbi:MAG: MATE family efflux transporter [Bacteroidales bacterium]|nr:MATE family efflux transporter [Bacteroidales bacterium]